MTTHGSLANIEKLEADLWEAADNLRANSKLTSSEYCMPVLGIIFLRHAANRFEAATLQIAADQKSGKMPKRKIIAADYVKRRALFLPDAARYENILATPTDADLAEAVIRAMTAIEESFEPLRGVLPKEFGIFERNVLEDLMRTFNREALRSATGDVFGRIYEYFLMKFAMQGAQDNGEFFTPPSLVQTLVNVIEPDHGVVADLACGSGGMFVQSSHFIEAHGGDTMRKVTFYGQEKTATTIKLAKMNLAVHGLEGHIIEANTFYQDEHRLEDGRRLFGNVDRMMANPPFNVDMVDAEKVKDDPRLPFGLPGVNKDKKVSNGNYLWISYFHSYLSPTGRAGFVMSSQASSAGHGEMEVRRRLVETGDVDVMISIRSNFFYTRTVPCELWHFDKGKPESRRDKVLMVDARNIYRKVNRKIFDFTPEQLQNLSSIVWLYRGQSDRFTALVQQYLERTLAEAADIAGHAAAFRKTYDALVKPTTTFLKSLPKDSPVRELVQERDDAAKSCFASLDAWTSRIAKDWKKPCAVKPAAQRKFSGELETLAAACRDLVKDVDLVFKLALRVVDSAEKDAGAKDDDSWNTRVIGKLEKDLEVHRAEIVEQLKATAYFERQAHWLISRFPDAKLVDVPGLVKLVDRQEIAAADWSLTPGRYVGVAPAEVDDDFDFEQALGDIHVEIKDLNQEAAELAKRIQTNFEGLGV
jgi:type I restriction enzyme M protein